MKHEGMKRLKIQLPQSLKAKLDALRAEGTTASGLIRRLLNEFFGMRSTKERRPPR
jgi:metal-responsive CopG/Arc/MetJ family transcriptional regulator